MSPFENLVGYLGVAGMAEEWWSTISQRSPFLTAFPKLYQGRIMTPNDAEAQ